MADAKDDPIERALEYVRLEAPMTDEQVRWHLMRACRNDSGAMFSLAAQVRNLKQELSDVRKLLAAKGGA